MLSYKYLFLAILFFVLAFPIASINTIIGTAFIHLSFVFAVLAFYSLKDIKQLLSFKQPMDLLKGYIFTIVIAAIIIVFINYTFYFLGFNDSKKVFNKIDSLPLPILLIALFIVPFTEEFFFRVLLLDKTNAFISSLLFAFAHASYSSYMELIDTFILGYIFCLSRKRFGLAVPIAVHLTINLISIAVVKLIGV